MEWRTFPSVPSPAGFPLGRCLSRAPSGADWMAPQRRMVSRLFIRAFLEGRAPPACRVTGVSGKAQSPYLTQGELRAGDNSASPTRVPPGVRRAGPGGSPQAAQWPSGALTSVPSSWSRSHSFPRPSGASLSTRTDFIYRRPLSPIYSFSKCLLSTSPPRGFGPAGSGALSAVRSPLHARRRL